MYSSLDRVDIVAESPEGERIFVQTDHRSREEMEREPEITLLFALTRMMAPRGWLEEGEPQPRIRYSAVGEVPPFLAEAIAVAGGELESGGPDGSLVELPAVERSATELGTAAFEALATKVLAREGLKLDQAGLEELEERVRRSLDFEDEIERWTRVAELAAVTGEVIRTTYGGRWVADEEHHFSTIPFLFEVDRGLINVCGKAEKFVEHGTKESPHHLLAMLDDPVGEDGPLMLSLKPHGWPSDDIVSETFPGGEDDWSHMGFELPVVAYGKDAPNTFAFLPTSHEEGDLAQIRAAALETLRSIEVPVEEHMLEGQRLLVASGSYYAAEKILDEAFLTGLQQRLGAELIMVGAPAKGLLFATSAMGGEDTIQHTLRFKAIVQGYFDDGGTKAISSEAFLVQEGRLTGVVRLAHGDDDAN